jgi:hypothetical protein
MSTIDTAAPIEGAYISELLEHQVVQLPAGRRAAYIRGAKSGRRYGTVHSLLGRRLVASANACRTIRNPDLLPGLIAAVNAVLSAKRAEQAEAIERLWDAAVAAGALEDA